MGENVRTMIVYATKTGSTRQCAQLLAERLPGAEVYDLEHVVPDITQADVVIIGSGVRRATLYEPALTFMNDHEQALMGKTVDFFLCNFYPTTFQRTIENNIPAQLRQHAIGVTSFGGKKPFSAGEAADWIDCQAIDQFVDTLQTTAASRFDTAKSMAE